MWTHTARSSTGRKTSRTALRFLRRLLQPLSCFAFCSVLFAVFNVCVCVCGWVCQPFSLYCRKAPSLEQFFCLCFGWPNEVFWRHLLRDLAPLCSVIHVGLLVVGSSVSLTKCVVCRWHIAVTAQHCWLYPRSYAWHCFVVINIQTTMSSSPVICARCHKGGHRVHECPGVSLAKASQRGARGPPQHLDGHANQYPVRAQIIGATNAR